MDYGVIKSQQSQYKVNQQFLFNSDRNYFMFFQFFFMGWKNDFTPLGFFFTVFFTSEENDEVMVFFTVFSTSEENSEVMVFFTVFFTENTQFQLSLNKVPFSTCKKFPHEIIFPCLKCFLFVIHLHLSWTLASPRKLGQQRSTWGANGSLRKKHFTARKNDFILETLLPLRKVTFRFHKMWFCVGRRASAMRGLL